MNETFLNYISPLKLSLFIYSLFSSRSSFSSKILKTSFAANLPLAKLYKHGPIYPKEKLPIKTAKNTVQILPDVYIVPV